MTHTICPSKHSGPQTMPCQPGGSWKTLSPATAYKPASSLPGRPSNYLPVYSIQPLRSQLLHYSDSQQTRPIRTQHNFCLRQGLCETTNRLGIKSRCIRTALSFWAKLLVWRHSLHYIVFPLYFALIDFAVKCIRRVLKPEVAHSQLFFPPFIYFSIFCLSPYIVFVASST